MDGRMDSGWIVGWMDKARWMGGLTDEATAGGWTDRETDGGACGRADGRMVRRRVGVQTDRQTHISLVTLKVFIHLWSSSEVPVLLYFLGAGRRHGD